MMHMEPDNPTGSDTKALSQSTETTSSISLDHSSNEEVPVKLIEPQRYLHIIIIMHAQPLVIQLLYISI